MNKTESIKYIQNSDATDFVVKAVTPYTRQCDLCKAYTYREFTITSKHITGCVKGIKNTGTSHITKHICIDCYKKLFPEDVL